MFYTLLLQRVDCLGRGIRPVNVCNLLFSKATNGMVDRPMMARDCWRVKGWKSSFSFTRHQLARTGRCHSNRGARSSISPHTEGRSVVLPILVLEFSAQAANHQVFSEVQECHTSNDARS